MTSVQAHCHRKTSLHIQVDYHGKNETVPQTFTDTPICFIWRPQISKRNRNDSSLRISICLHREIYKTLSQIVLTLPLRIIRRQRRISGQSEALNRRSNESKNEKKKKKKSSRTMNHASTSGIINIIFSSPQGPDRLWGHPSPLFNGYRGAFAKSKGAREWRLKWTHLRLNKVKDSQNLLVIK